MELFASDSETDDDDERGPEINHRMWLRTGASFGSTSASHLYLGKYGSGHLRLQDCNRSVEFILEAYNQRSVNETKRFLTKLRLAIDKAEDAVRVHAKARNLTYED